MCRGSKRLCAFLWGFLKCQVLAAPHPCHFSGLGLRQATWEGGVCPLQCVPLPLPLGPPSPSLLPPFLTSTAPPTTHLCPTFSQLALTGKEQIKSLTLGCPALIIYFTAEAAGIGLGGPKPPHWRRASVSFCPRHPRVHTVKGCSSEHSPEPRHAPEFLPRELIWAAASRLAGHGGSPEASVP